MSEKRYSVKDSDDEWWCNVAEDGLGLSPHECADLLNTQAETIEVLRQIISGRIVLADEYFYVSDKFKPETPTQFKRKELAKRRIAALEGE